MSPKRFVGVSNFQASNDFVNHPFGHHITNNINIGFRQKKLATTISIVTMSSINMFSIDNISLIFMPMTPSIFHKTTGWPHKHFCARYTASRREKTINNMRLLRKHPQKYRKETETSWIRQNLMLQKSQFSLSARRLRHRQILSLITAMWPLKWKHAEDCCQAEKTCELPMQITEIRADTTQDLHDCTVGKCFSPRLCKALCADASLTLTGCCTEFSSIHHLHLRNLTKRSEIASCSRFPF